MSLGASITGEVWVQSTSTKMVYCIKGKEFELIEEFPSGNQSVLKYEYEPLNPSERFSIRVDITMQDEEIVKYTKPSGTACRVIKNDLDYEAF